MNDFLEGSERKAIEFLESRGYYVSQMSLKQRYLDKIITLQERVVSLQSLILKYQQYGYDISKFEKIEKRKECEK